MRPSEMVRMADDLRRKLASRGHVCLGSVSVELGDDFSAFRSRARSWCGPDGCFSHRAGRSVAYYYDPGDGGRGSMQQPKIVLSPRLARFRFATVLGVIAHELGHAIDIGEPMQWALDGDKAVRVTAYWSPKKWRARGLDIEERTADAIAEYILGEPIGYFGPYLMQTVGKGFRPRPMGLKLSFRFYGRFYERLVFMALSTNLGDLTPDTLEKWNQLIGLAREHGLELKVRSTGRTCAEQNSLYAIGRTVPGAKVTQARGCQSYHVLGRAVDFDIVKGPQDYPLVGQLAKSIGMKWGGDFPGFYDPGHVQYNPGPMSIAFCCPDPDSCTINEECLAKEPESKKSTGMLGVWAIGAIAGVVGYWFYSRRYLAWLLSMRFCQTGRLS